VKSPYISKSSLNRFLTSAPKRRLLTQIAGCLPEDNDTLRNLAPIFIEKIDEIGGLLRGPDSQQLALPQRIVNSGIHACGQI
jgi:hypothetical protein